MTAALRLPICAFTLAGRNPALVARTPTVPDTEIPVAPASRARAGGSPYDLDADDLQGNRDGDRAVRPGARVGSDRLGRAGDKMGRSGKLTYSPGRLATTRLSRGADGAPAAAKKPLPLWAKILVLMLFPSIGAVAVLWLIASGQATFDGSRFLSGLPLVLFSVATVYICWEMFKLRFGPKGKDLSKRAKWATILLPIVAIVATGVIAMPQEWKDAIGDLFK